MNIKLILLAIGILIMVSCGPQKSDELGYYTIIDSVRLTEPAMLYPMKLFEENTIIAIDIYSKEVQIISLQTGNVISRYQRKGKGPGELLDPCSIIFFENQVWIGDRKNNKIINLEYDEGNFTFIKEFKLASNFFDITIINNEYLLISVWGNEFNSFLYDLEGNFIKKYNLIDSSENITTNTDLWNNTTFSRSHGNYIITTSLISKELFLYKFHANNHFQLISKYKINDYENGYRTKDTGQFVGLADSFVFQDGFYISVNPKISLNRYFFYSFDYTGTYIGKFQIKDYHFTEICAITFSENSDTLWFMDTVNNDKIIFIASLSVVYK